MPERDAPGASDAAEPGWLIARPGAPTGPAPTGLHALGGAGRPAGLLYVPPSYAPERPAPFTLMLHGAGSNAERVVTPMREWADGTGLILFAPNSRAATWDVLHGGFGPDVAVIDRALHDVFGRYAVDPAHLAIEGFSDGASYALSLGLTNGDLFTHIIACSPGFAAPAAQRGRPRIFVSHGRQDPVLPIEPCSGRIVPALLLGGYDVRFEPFEGGHTMPPAIVRAALDWFLGE
ncbi:MAG TPA: phospholipase [Chloroflexota bacterium]|jgi:predicted esterase